MMGVFRSTAESIQTQAALKFKFERFGLNLRLIAKQAVNLQNFITQSRVNLLGLNFTCDRADRVFARSIELLRDQAAARSLKQAVKVIQQEIFFLRRALVIRLDSFAVDLFHKALFA